MNVCHLGYPKPVELPRQFGHQKLVPGEKNLVGLEAESIRS
jgi:hypothetical protein